MVKTLSGLLIFVLFPSIAAISQINTISSRGVGGGGALFSPVISPYDPGKIFMSCDMTELFYSEDDGLSWDFYHFLDFVAFQNSEIQFTSDPEILYSIRVDFRNDYYFPTKSTDGGDTWNAINDPTGNYCQFLFADHHAVSRFITGSDSKLYFTDDGGDNYALIYSAPAERLYISGAFWKGDSIFIGTNNGMLYSVNGGASFDFFTNSGLPANTAFTSFTGAFDGTNMVLTGVAGNKTDLYYYNEAWAYDAYEGIFTLSFGIDITWQDISPVDNVQFYHSAMNPENTDIIYAGGSSTINSYIQIYKSIDGGESWTSIFETAYNENIITGWCGDGGEHDWWYAEIPFGLCVDPNNADHVIFTDYGFMHISNDGGNNWRQAYVTSATQNPAGEDIIPGNTYAGTFENTSCWDIFRHDENIMLAGFSDVSGISSDDKGESWSFKRINDDYNSVYQIIGNPTNNFLYAATGSVHDLYQSTRIDDDDIGNGNGEILYSTDDGISWQTMHNFNDPVVWIVFDPGNLDIMYASVVHEGTGGIYKTINAQDLNTSVWEKLPEPSGTEDHPYIVRVLNDGAVVCSYSANKDGSFYTSSGIFYSEDGGTIWEDRSDINFNYWTKDIVVDLHDPDQNTWYACIFTHWGTGAADQGGLYRTKDRGLTWNKLETFFRCESITVNPLNENEAYITTEDDGLWITKNLTDGDPTFTRVSEYKFQHPVRTFYDAFDNLKVWIASFGNGISLLIKDDEIQIAEFGDIKFSLSPNPCTDQINIQSEMIIQQIKIYTITGNLVTVAEPNDMNYQIATTNFSPGIYFVEIKFENGELRSSRMIVSSASN
ncbi:MAG: T9SS type A sorting domain-containing protein [Chitinophagales bacterium]